MTSTAIHIVASASAALAATPYTFAALADVGRTVRVYSSVDARVAIGSVANESALPLAAKSATLIDLPAGVYLSAVKGSGADDGSVHFTTVKRV